MSDDVPWDGEIPGWQRIGRIDKARRRALWMRCEYDDAEPLRNVTAIELRAGREGDDFRARIDRSNPQFRELHDVLTAAQWAVDIDGGWYDETEGFRW